MYLRIRSFLQKDTEKNAARCIAHRSGLRGAMQPAALTKGISDNLSNCIFASREWRNLRSEVQTIENRARKLGQESRICLWHRQI